ncbi:MAG: hypothetical protein V1934_08015 [Methanobacteriota archaeon]
MKFIEPDDLKIPRAYFTEFDRINYSQIERSREEIREIAKALERKVKFLGLIKGMVVIDAADIYKSEMCKNFLSESEIVLKEGLLVPTLASKHKDFSEFLAFEREHSPEKHLYAGKEAEEIDTFIAGYVETALRWDAGASTKWFKKRLICDLEDERSVLRFNTPNVQRSTVKKVVKRIRALKSPERIDIYKIAKDSHNKELWFRLSEYADFIYYLSNARAVNCEGVLPQENLMEFSITDLTGHKTTLSDWEIFYRILTSIIKDRTQKIFPVEILDNLTFEDIVELRKNLLHDDFIHKYNGLIDKTKERVEIADATELVLNMEEIMEMETELHKTFTDAVNSEVGMMRGLKRRCDASKILINTGALLTFYGQLESVAQITANTISMCGYGEMLDGMENSVRHKVSNMIRYIDRRSLDDKPVLLKFLSEVSKKQSAKYVGM